MTVMQKGTVTHTVILRHWYIEVMQREDGVGQFVAFEDSQTCPLV